MVIINSIVNTGFEAIGFKSYQDYLNSYMWKDKRDLILSFATHCEECGVYWREEIKTGIMVQRYIQILEEYEPNRFRFRRKRIMVPERKWVINKFQVHHLRYDNVGNEPRNDLRVVCMSCHEKLTKEMKSCGNV